MESTLVLLHITVKISVKAIFSRFVNTLGAIFFDIVHTDGKKIFSLQFKIRIIVILSVIIILYN